MKKLIVLLIAVGAISIVNAKEVKKLHYNYNDNVTIWISNEDCPFKEYSRLFPWKAEAVRSDGDTLIGCFNGENNTVTIQWHKGDKSMFPANSFLINK